MSGLRMIWAQSVTGILGADGGILWRVPAGFAHFKATTMGCGLVIRRTTWDSLGGPLPRRRNVVFTRDRSWWAEGAVHAGSLREGLSLAAQGPAAEPGHDPHEGDAAGLSRLWIIGSRRVYEQALDNGLSDVLVISVLDLDVAQRARERGLPDSALVRTSGVSTQGWAIDPALSGPRGQWRPAPGDARQRVETWRHLQTRLQRPRRALQQVFSARRRGAPGPG